MSATRDLLASEEPKVAPSTYEAAALQHGELPDANGPPAGTKPLPHGPFPLDMPVLNQLRGKRVILASASLRRKKILSAIGFTNLEILPPTTSENLSKEVGPFEYVLQTAMQKCLDVYTITLQNSLGSITYPALVIAADTIIVANNGHILEKPRSEKDHVDMLKILRDQRVHKCLTAVVALDPRGNARDWGYNIEKTVVETKVVFAEEVGDELINAYVRTRESVDAAAGFGLRGLGSLLLEGIEGSWDNVLGLPLRATMGLVEKVMLNQRDFGGMQGQRDL